MRVLNSNINHLGSGITAMVLIAFLFSSCTKEELIQPTSVEQFQERSFDLSDPANSTESSRDVQWRDGGIGEGGDLISDDGDDEGDNERSSKH